MVKYLHALSPHSDLRSVFPIRVLSPTHQGSYQFELRKLWIPGQIIFPVHDSVDISLTNQLIFAGLLPVELLSDDTAKFGVPENDNDVPVLRQVWHQSKVSLDPNKLMDAYQTVSLSC